MQDKQTRVGYQFFEAAQLHQTCRYKLSALHFLVLTGVSVICSYVAYIYIYIYVCIYNIYIYTERDIRTSYKFMVAVLGVFLVAVLPMVCLSL